jgi:hypothetical protein
MNKILGLIWSTLKIATTENNKPSTSIFYVYVCTNKKPRMVL